MRHKLTTLAASFTSLALLTAALTPSAAAIGFGSKDTSVKLTHSGPFKGKSTLAIGSFRVAFVTDDVASSSSHGVFANGGSAARMSGLLTNVDQPLMQKIADEIYADFLKQAAAKGYTIIDSAKLAALSPAYSQLTPTVNFAPSRLGTLVIPTGQRSIPLAADDSAKEEKGSSNFGTAFHNLGKQLAKSDANTAFPKAAKDAGTTVIGVTLVVNFADFKGTSSSFGNSKATIAIGATIDGRNNKELAMSTAIVAWDAGTLTCPACMAEASLEGNIHSTASIGEAGTYDAMRARDKASNQISDLRGGLKVDKKATVITADPAAYESNVLSVSAEATDMLLTAIAKEK